MRALIVSFVLLSLASGTAKASSPDPKTINEAQWAKIDKSAPSPLLIKAQVLLDRSHFSPGEIDGKLGDNFRKALSAYAAARGIKTSGDLDEQVWQSLQSPSSENVVTDYVISDEDVRGPFVERIPARMEQQKDLPALGYTSAREKLAERFHMSEALLTALNPGRKFDQAGEIITVTNVKSEELPEKVARIEIDKTHQMLHALSRDQKLVAAYPITAGSTEKPAPNGRLKVTGIQKNPTYRYNPKYAFKGVRSDKPFTIKPGPNNPVGLVWIGLSAEGYGIHGTPDPSKVSKSESHGCIRLTNWDVLQLSSAVAKGTPVDFVGDERAGRDAQAKSTRQRRRR
jgi:lipoprotein-anchoring transpeptidase ErfK/SrfK